jgi:AraC-like DNA-binding protein
LPFTAKFYTVEHRENIQITPTFKIFRGLRLIMSDPIELPPETTSIFHDIDELCSSIVAQELDFQQFEAGNCRLQLRSTPHTNSVSIQKIEMDKRFFQHGAMQREMVTFGLVTRANGTMSWNSFAIQERHLLIFPSGNQFECFSNSGFGGYTINMPKELLASIADSHEISVATVSLGSVAQVIPITAADEVQLKLLMEQALTSWSDSQQKRVCEYLLPLKLLTLLEKDNGEIQPAKITARSKTLERARQYIIDNAHQPMSLNDIALVSHASSRSVQRAFLEYFEVSPADYIQLLRLNRARALLRKNDTSTSVSTIAMECGFSHMGRFSERYRQHFGELPSKTLRR